MFLSVHLSFKPYFYQKNRMLHSKLTHPKSIAVIGGSNNIHKPGGKLVENLLKGDFPGNLYVVNPKETTVQGITCVKSILELPDVDLAILAIPAKYCSGAVKQLSEEKNTRGFIIISAGFSEGDEEGKAIEENIAAKVNKVGGSLIGPNCIGVINQQYRGVFTTPVPNPDIHGADLISGSGATAVFIMETGMVMGLHFNEVYSVGNSAQVGVEDVLEHLDETFDPETSSKTKLLYIENIQKPDKLLKHAASLIKKGCRIAAIKAGSSEAGIRAASSHTGALASSDIAVRALFRKAGIVYCSGRLELITVASIFNYIPLKGKNIAVITHAGGSAVMLTDALEKGGLKVPPLEGPKTDELLSYLHPGSSVANPIDFLATGTADQLGIIIDYCEYKFDEIDGMVVVFGSPGLFNVENVYKVLNVKMDICSKPIYPVLPSLINAQKEIGYMLSKGKVNFPDEVLLGTALAEVYHTPFPSDLEPEPAKIDEESISGILKKYKEGEYLHSLDAFAVLDACSISNASPFVIKSPEEIDQLAEKFPCPWVLKVSGPVHKTDVQGVTLNVNTREFAKSEVNRMMKIKDADGVIVQPMVKGFELFSGAVYEERIGHLVLVGLGGIYIEIIKDIRAALAPFDKAEALKMIRRLASYPLIKGMRGQKGTDENLLAEILFKLSSLVQLFPEIKEVDLNPLIASDKAITCVDVRIKV
jgi:acetyltransferase